MKNSSEWIFAVSSCLRMCLMAVLGQSIGLLICDTMMIRKRPLKILAVGTILKAVVLLMFTCWIDYCFPASDMGQVAVALSNVWGVVFVSALFAFTYEGGVLKCIIGMGLSELVVSVLVLPSVILINTLEGREYVTSFSGALMWIDLGIVVLAWALTLLLYPLLKSFLQKYRKFVPGYRKVLWPAVVTYFSSAQLMPILGVQNNQAFVFTMFFLYLFCSIMVVLYVAVIYRRYRKKIQLESELLHMERKLMEGHYIATQWQIRQKENNRRLVAQQMENLTAMTENSVMQEAGIGKRSEEERRSVLEQRIKVYLEDLHSEYDQLQAGMYCNDWMVDAVLYCQIETAKRQGMEVDCSLQGYDRGQIVEEDLVGILYRLFAWGMQQMGDKQKKWKDDPYGKKKLELHMSAVKNQLVLQFSGSGKIRNKYLLKDIRYFVKKYSGMITVKNGFSIEIIMRRDE